MTGSAFFRVPTPPTENRVCAVCGHVLDHAEPLGWFHPQRKDSDHVAVPVRPEDMPHVVIRCDLCNVDLPGEWHWSLPVKPFNFPPGTQHMSNEDFAMCDACNALATAENWDGLLVKMTKAIQHAYPDEVGARFVRLWFDTIRRNITGAPIRVHSRSKLLGNA